METLPWVVWGIHARYLSIRISRRETGQGSLYTACRLFQYCTILCQELHNVYMLLGMVNFLQFKLTPLELIYSGESRERYPLAMNTNVLSCNVNLGCYPLVYVIDVYKYHSNCPRVPIHDLHHNPAEQPGPVRRSWSTPTSTNLHQSLYCGSLLIISHPNWDFRSP